MEALFKGKTLIITGGLGDIGRAVARAFAEQGAKIALCDVHPVDAAAGFLRELDALNVQAAYDRVDVRDATAVSVWVEKVAKTLGTPDLIVANAATVTVAPILEMAPGEWARELDVNLNGAFYLVQSATARLIEEGRTGSVVFIGSWAAHVVHTDIPAYCVSKAAMRMLCKCLALELAPQHILVNELALGFVDAGLSGKRFAASPGLREEALGKVPVKKLITPRDVASQVVRLCHPTNEHITGTTLLMDGGLSL